MNSSEVRGNKNGFNNCYLRFMTPPAAGWVRRTVVAVYGRASAVVVLWLCVVGVGVVAAAVVGAGRRGGSWGRCFSSSV